MTPKVPLHFFRLSRGVKEARVRLNRLAEEVNETGGMPEHARKAADPIKWDATRIQRVGNDYVYVSADDFGPDREVILWRVRLLQ